jgi:cell division protein FtsW
MSRLARLREALSTRDQPLGRLAAGGRPVAAADRPGDGHLRLHRGGGKSHRQPWYFGIRHGIFLLGALALAAGLLRVPLAWWKANGPLLLLVGIVLLILVLLVGREVNGSRRWLSVPGVPFNLQASELAKLFLIVYLAGYLERFLPQVRREWGAFLRPLLVMGLIGVLLILEPDYGAVVVMTGCVMGMLLMAGAPWGRFLLLALLRWPAASSWPSPSPTAWRA